LYERGYPRLKRHVGNLTGYLQLVRPFTLLAPLLAGIIGVITPVDVVTFDILKTAIHVGITLALAQGCGQCLNQYADVEIDSINKPYRPLPSGALAREEALGLSWLLGIAAIGRGFWIDPFFGTIVLTLVFFAAFYSMPPFSPRKVHPYFNVFWMAFARGFLPMLGVYCITGNITQGWVYSILAFLWVMGFQSTKDVGDIEGDLKFGIKTIPNTYGMIAVRQTMFTCLLVYSFVATIMGVWYMLVLVPVGLFAIFATNKKSKLTENNYGWTAFYLGLALIYVAMALGVRGL